MKPLSWVSIFTFVLWVLFWIIYVSSSSFLVLCAFEIPPHLPAEGSPLGFTMSVTPIDLQVLREATEAEPSPPSVTSLFLPDSPYMKMSQQP